MINKSNMANWIILISVASCCIGKEDAFLNATTEVLVKDVRSVTFQELREAKTSFSIDSFNSIGSECKSVYIASYDPVWLLELEILKLLNKKNSPLQVGETYAVIIHSPVMILGLGLNDAVGKTATVDFLFLRNEDGSASLALEVPILH